MCVHISNTLALRFLWFANLTSGQRVERPHDECSMLGTFRAHTIRIVERIRYTSGNVGYIRKHV